MEIHPFFSGNWPVVIGHRGAAGTSPENTLFSFNDALAQGADIIECDLHLSSDGVPVIIHDATIDRTTNGTGRVVDLSQAELATLDAGGSFSTDGGKTFPFRGEGIKIPTLSEALLNFPDTRFCLELKDKSSELVEKTIDALIDHSHAEKALLATFDYGTQRHIYRLLKRKEVDIPVTASRFEAGWAVFGSKIGFIPPPSKVGIFAMPQQRKGLKLLSKDFCNYIHRHHRRLYAWTIDEENEVKSLLENGVDGIATNYPAMVLPHILAARKKRQ